MHYVRVAIEVYVLNHGCPVGLGEFLQLAHSGRIVHTGLFDDDSIVAEVVVEFQTREAAERFRDACEMEHGGEAEIVAKDWK